MTHARRFSAILAFGLVLAGALPAQEPGPLAPGTRVRLTWRDEPARLDGEFRALRGDTIVVFDSLHQREAALPLAWLRSVEVYGGRRRGWAMTTLGFVAGGAAGGLLAHALWTPPVFPDCGYTACFRFSRETLTVIGAAAGAGLFGVIGYFLDTADRWEPVLTDRVRLALTPMPAGRLGLGATVGF